MSLLTEQAEDYILGYNRSVRGRQYNRIAASVYEARRTLGNSLSSKFEPHIIKGLKGFDMARTMTAGIADRLHRCLEALRMENTLTELSNKNLSTTDLGEYGSGRSWDARSRKAVSCRNYENFSLALPRIVSHCG